jgi:hypothetical protein
MDNWMLKVDAQILAALDEGPRKFAELHGRAMAEAKNSPTNGSFGDVYKTYRAVDRRLQSLRKRGLIEYWHARWHLVVKP